MVSSPGHSAQGAGGHALILNLSLNLNLILNLSLNLNLIVMRNDHFFFRVSSRKYASCLMAIGAFLLWSLPAAGQFKRSFAIEDFDHWNSIESTTLSADGRWISYVLRPDQGDPVLVLRNNGSGQERRFERADALSFSADGAYAVFRIHPARDSINAMRRRKVDKAKLPLDTLAILALPANGAPPAEPERIPQLKNYQLPAKWSGWLAYGIKTPLPDSLTKRLDKESYRLVLRRLGSADSLYIDGVKAYAHAEEGAAFLVHSAGRDTLIRPGMYYFDAGRGRLDTLLTGKGDYRSMALSRDGSRVAFVADRDTTKARIRPFVLHGWQRGDRAPTPIAQAEGRWRVSEHAAVTFSYDQSKLYFGRALPPILSDTTLLDEEVVQVEVWNYNAPRLYTQEEVRLERERKRAYTCVWHWDKKAMTPLHDETAPELATANRGDGNYALAYDETPYLPATQWEGSPARKDLYVVNVATGERRSVARAMHGSPQWSPGGNYVYWYSPSDTAWMAYGIADGQLRQLTNNSLEAFYDEENDVPDYPDAYGLAGWTEGDKAMLVYDRFDWWRLDPQGKTPPQRLTRGREAQRRLRYVQTDPEARHLPAKGKVLIHSFSEQDYNEGYAWLHLPEGRLEELVSGPYSFTTQVRKARHAEAYLYTQENFQQFPNLRFTPDFRTTTIVSDANPQQSQYLWGSIEHYTWISLDGKPLKGLLLKPEGFDPSRKYPMIVNFYERNSETIHDHRPLFPHRSQINYPYYLSKGYVIFNPDIPYREGYPGESAYNAVVAGVTALIGEGFVDPARIGIQGHSWGGYQIAYLLTRTSLFRCAESGAPVVNMISAYGGIRWESGLSRQFQYERTQSRIGGSLWEYPLRFLENSPIFTTDKVTTPVLILHNDADGAVPWYQGIEWFTALRRLGKPAWLLNYNDEPHWPVKRQNRIDFQRRMSQFFDHYLMDGPLPEWMKTGVSPMAKGILQGY